MYIYGWFNKSSFRADRKQVEVWDFDKPDNSKLHPTMKPIELCAYVIQNSSISNQINHGPIRRIRKHTHSMRTNRQKMLYDGIRPTLLLRNNKKMGRIHRAKSCFNQLK